MNLLAPDCFVSFYLELTRRHLALINNPCFVHGTDSVHYGSRILKCRVLLPIRKYKCRGFTVSEDPSAFDQHNEYCYTRKCRLTRYSNDIGVLRINFTASERYEFPDPLNDIVSWCLAGQHCNGLPGTSTFHPFHVSLV